ncbi:MAG: phosphoserine transaminase [Aestuariivita sp.]|nr:phosphoserine transaminase [Aestuariivita sp.]MCY4345676.1 phosphoserine transaminase [Aestuariivita sp.]
MNNEKPPIRPKNPCFSSGPCSKPPSFTLAALEQAALGRSHRSTLGKSKLRSAIDETHELLEIPPDYKVAIVPASDTGAFEMAMWNLLGTRTVDALVWESFGSGWFDDCVKQLQIPTNLHRAEFGEIIDFSAVNWDHDVCFTWNGTTSGVRIPSGALIPSDRAGLTLCDATSAAFAMRLPWDKLDVTTFSWQKVLGGEGAHGVIILSPRAIDRLMTYSPRWPLPKIFRLTKNGAVNQALFDGATINTPSMLAVEDYLHCLSWAHSVGGLSGLIDRSNRNAAAVWEFCDAHNWIENLAVEPSTRSTTSVCLKFTDPAIAEQAQFSKAIAKRLEDETVAFDIASYRDAPAGLRIWCGATVETDDVLSMLPWVTWAYEIEREAVD